VLKNGFYNALGGIVRIGVALISVPLLIRLIGIEDYGVWTLASSVIGVATLAEGGISISTTFFLSKDISDNDSTGISETLTATFVAMFSLATFAGLVLYFFSDYFILLFSKLKHEQAEQVLSVLRLGSLYLWAKLIQQHSIGIMQAHEKYGLINILGTLQSCIGNLGLIIIAAIGGNIVEMMKWQVIQVFSALVIYILISIKVVKYAKPCFRWNKIKNIEILKYSSVAWIGTLGSSLFTQGDRLVVASILDIKNLGIYAAITTIASQINILSALPVSPLVPRLAKLAKCQSPNKSEIIRQLKESQQLNSLVAFSCGSFIIMFANNILSFIIKDNITVESIYALKLSAIIYSIYSLNAVGYYALYGIGKIKDCTAIHLISSLISIFLIRLISIKFGLVGAILGNAGYIITLLMTILSLRELKIKIAFLIKWLSFPFLWLSIAGIIGLNLGDENSIKIIIYLAEILIIAIWFLKENSKLEINK
jgi:O-antigen/teichoic acid export membrane protein